MHPTKAQRDELQALSVKLFGASSRWQKLQRDTPVFSGYEPYGKSTKQYQEALRQHRADVASGEALSEFQPPMRAVYRSPTIEEVLTSLRYFSDKFDYERGHPEEVATKAAKEFVAKKLSVAIVLEVPEQEKEEFEKLVEEIGGDEANWIRHMLAQNVAQANQVGMVRVNGLLFAKNILQVKAA